MTLSLYKVPRKRTEAEKAEDREDCPPPQPVGDHDREQRRQVCAQLRELIGTPATAGEMRLSHGTWSRIVGGDLDLGTAKRVLKRFEEYRDGVRLVDADVI